MPTITPERLREFTAVLQKYKTGKASLERRVVSAENWWKLRNRFEERKEGLRGGEGYHSESGWLHNVIVSKHADAMEAYPEPLILPREPGDEQQARLLSAILPCNALNVLVFFVTFACDEDDPMVAQHHAGGLDGLVPVFDGEHVAAALFRHTGFHLFQNLIRVFQSRIVGGENHAAALTTGNLRHHWAFQRVSVATTAHYRQHLLTFAGDVVNRAQHVLQRIRGVRIVDDGHAALAVADDVEASLRRCQTAHLHQHGVSRLS